MYYVIAIFTSISSIVSLYYAIEALIKTRQIDAQYAFARG